jgi:glycosyltransferase involved in cell wall biosynthesis
MSKTFLEYLHLNSYLSERYKLFYVSTPKVACTTTKWWFASLEECSKDLRRFVDSDESDPDLVIHDGFKKIAPNVTGLSPGAIKKIINSEEYFKFALVRNPFNRIFSAWQSKLFLQEPLQIGPYTKFDFFNYPIESLSDVAMAFEGFLEHLSKNESPLFWDNHWTPQSSLIRPDLLSYSKLVKLENSFELTKAIDKHAGQILSDPFSTYHINRSIIPFNSALFTPRSIELIISLYSRDFEIFEYDTVIPEPEEEFSEEQFDIALRATKMIRARHRMLEGRNIKIANLNQMALDREEKLSDLQEIIWNRDNQISSMNKNIIYKNQEVERLYSLVTRKNKVISHLRLNISELNNDLIKLRASRFWRIINLLYFILGGAWIGAIKTKLGRVYNKFLQAGALEILRITISKVLKNTLMSVYAYKLDLFIRAWRKTNRINWYRLAVPFQPGLVSIVLPSYNGEELIRDALDSLINQTYKNIEIITINDGSDDETGSILKEYAQRDSRIRVYEQKNQKLPKTLSRGFRLARGEFLTWTSDDNVLKINCIELLVASIQKDKSLDMVYANIDIIDEFGIPLNSSHWYEGYQSPHGSNHIHLPSDTSELNDFPNNFIGAAFLYRARVAWTIGDYSQPRFLAEDYDYWMRVNELMTLRHVDFDDCIYDYRFHQKSLTSRDEELGITANRGALMLFDDFRRSFYLSDCIWVVTSDDDKASCNIADSLKIELKSRKFTMVNLEDLKKMKLSRLWIPLVHVHCTESLLDSFQSEQISDMALRVLLTSKKDFALADLKYDLYITMANVDPINLTRLENGYAGWWAIPHISDVVTLCNIKVKNKHLEHIEHKALVASATRLMSVIVCTYRRSATLENCLRSLLKQTLSSNEYEIIIVNNDPADFGPSNALKKLELEFKGCKIPELLIVDCPLPGLSYARNAGISESRGSIIMFMDDDAIASVDCLQYIADGFKENPNVGVIGGHIHLKIPNPRPDVCPLGREALWSEFLTKHRTFSELKNWWEFPYGALWSARRELLFEVGGFRHNFGRIGNDYGGGEEIVASLMAVRLGYAIGVEPRAEVLHDVEPKRYCRLHVRKTIEASLAVNYKMQSSMYLPCETTLSVAIKNFISASARLMKVKLKNIINWKKYCIDELYASAQFSGHVVVLKLKCSDFLNRLRCPQVSK